MAPLIRYYDPETYEETTHVERTELRADDIRQLRLLQTWYWDARRHRLSIHLDAVAPLVDVLDIFEELRYRRPLFYRRIKR